MKFWKVLVLLSLPYLILGCCKCKDYITITQYNYCSISSNTISSFTNEANAISTADTIDKDNFGLRINIETNTEVCKTPTSIFRSAHACKCPEPYQNAPSVGIKKISIRTLNDFDNTHLAGDLITDYFEEFYGPIYRTIDEFSFYFQDKKFEGQGRLLTGPFDLKLIKSPPISSKQAFEISIELADDKVLTTTTREVFLN